MLSADGTIGMRLSESRFRIQMSDLIQLDVVRYTRNLLAMKQRSNIYRFSQLFAQHPHHRLVPVQSAENSLVANTFSK